MQTTDLDASIQSVFAHSPNFRSIYHQSTASVGPYIVDYLVPTNCTASGRSQHRAGIGPYT
ncbi:hypothetical protein M404DRAFT_991496 [Pisolithus tinctorius Marx 270]|uniref:Uncharacterized protein n=1 Tax=Pisolithus tinctorius Marx 270 TaxID=870435 RepID=A0A0C3KZ25_PISTI|nr:hypothetical protein M404DRAFT_991496 [Pisolithus tinctorius Marx 270]